MRVLYVVFEALLGGHVLSTLTISREMSKHGITPMFAGGKGLLVKEIETSMPFFEVNIPLSYHGRPTYFTGKSFAAVRQIQQIIEEQQIDLIHAFDARSYVHAYLAGVRQNIPVLCTLCGGVDPYYNLPRAEKIIVFSEEQKNKMVKTFNWISDSVEVIRTRLDMEKIQSPDVLLEEQEASDFGLNPNLPKIMMISSFDSTKIKSVFQVLAAAEYLFEQGVKFQLVMIGGKGVLHSNAVKQSQKICERFPGCIVMTGPVVNAYRLLQRATIVLGVGRSAFEGMIYAKPTLIVGEKGYAGTVSEETVDPIGWYNFSGRNQKEEVSAEELANAIRDILSCEVKAKHLGAFAKDFIAREVDVRVGAKKIKDIYLQLISHQGDQSQLSQRLSFLRCLLPIVFDNGVHSFKLCIKKIVRSK
jgi:glycosyltransferase involved in cell wall biosynthesis